MSDAAAEVDAPPALLRPLADALLAAGEAVVILGAGCAGLAAAVALTRRGIDREIALIDRRTGWQDDRTWSFWSADGDPAASSATAAWSDWRVTTDTADVLRRRRGLRYRRVRGIDHYRASLAELAGSGRVHLRLGERVLRLEERPDAPPVVVTSTGRIVPGLLIDCRGPRLDAATVADARRRGVWLGQEFLGLRVRAKRPVFDASAATLLDFRLPQRDGIRFAYVLPTSPTEALVESVRIAPGAHIDVRAHHDLLRSYLADRFGLGEGDVTVLGEERGCIPMTDADPGGVRGPGHVALGLAGGGARPSTGYAFLRIQRSAAALADALVAGRTPDLALDGPRRRLLDAVFLRFLVRHPDDVPAVFARMFARTPPAALLRFLGDTSTVLDEALLIAALPKVPFLAILAGLPFERRRPSRAM